MTARCELCEGTRELRRTTALGVALVICSWCVQRYGPKAHEHRFDIPRTDLAQFLDQRSAGDLR